MLQAEVLKKLQSVFDEVFLDKVVVTPSLTAHDVEEWDSLLHVTLVPAMEQEFGIRFRVGEVEATTNVGQLADVISKRLQKR
jgi:acyl carrier protein